MSYDEIIVITPVSSSIRQQKLGALAVINIMACSIYCNQIMITYLLVIFANKIVK